MAVTDASLPGLLKLLGDPTRLRILALLDREELAVGEISRTLGLAQSRVSNHLRLLRENRLLLERHVGTQTFVKAANGQGSLPRIWAALRDELENLPEHGADLVRLDAILAERRARDGDFFDRVAGEWDKIKGAFATGQARLRAANQLLPRDVVLADLGCGTGYMGEALLGLCERLIAVDRSAKMLEQARQRLAKHRRGTAVEFRQGEMDALPIGDGELDGLVAGMVLHHLPAFEPAVAEMARVLKPGGSAVILELAPHKEAWMRAELGDRHLGLEPQDVVAALRRAGFAGVALDPPDDHYEPARGGGGEQVSLDLYIVRGRKEPLAHATPRIT